MNKQYILAVAATLAVAAWGRPAQAVAPGPRRPEIVRLLRRQAMQYAGVRTLHFKCVEHGKLLGPHARRLGNNIFEGWFSGQRFRIDYVQLGRHAPSDIVFADDGHHAYYLNRINHYLYIDHTNPRRGAVQFDMTPILSPFFMLIPARAGKYPQNWIQVKRFLGRMGSVLSRCDQVRPAPQRRAGYVYGSIHGALPAGNWGMSGVYHVQVSTARPRLLRRSTFRGGGIHIVFQIIKYKRERLDPGRSIWLPLKSRMTSFIGGHKASIITDVITKVQVNKPLPAGVFHVSYRHAKAIFDDRENRWLSPTGKPMREPVKKALK